MSHVDDGPLHALLDGALPAGEAATVAVEAHLGVCADCRGRLERERAIKARAGDVLALSAPTELPAPPFEEILARHGGQATSVPSVPASPVRARGHVRSPVPLAWAASVLLALGAGWMAHVVLEDSGLDAVRQAEQTTDMAESAGSVDAIAGIGAPANTAPAAADAAAGGGATQEPANAAGVESAASTPVPTGPATAADATSARRDTDMQAPPPAPTAASNEVRPGALVGQQAAAPPPSVDARLNTLTAQQGSATLPVPPAGRAIGAPPQAAPPPPAPPPSGVPPQANALADVLARVREEKATPWEPASAGYVSAVLGRSPVGLPDLQPVRREVALAGDSARVRTLYMLDGGTALELTEWVRDGGAAARERTVVEGATALQMAESKALAPTAMTPVAGLLPWPDAMSTRSVDSRVDGATVRLRGDLSQERLAELAVRLRRLDSSGR